MISYKPFWETMKKKGVSQYALITKHEMSNGTITRLKHNMPIETTTIERLCKILDCAVQDVLEYIPDEDV